MSSCLRTQVGRKPEVFAWCFARNIRHATFSIIARSVQSHITYLANHNATTRIWLMLNLLISICFGNKFIILCHKYFEMEKGKIVACTRLPEKCRTVNLAEAPPTQRFDVDKWKRRNPGRYFSCIGSIHKNKISFCLLFHSPCESKMPRKSIISCTVRFSCSCCWCFSFDFVIVAKRVAAVLKLLYKKNDLFYFFRLGFHLILALSEPRDGWMKHRVSFYRSARVIIIISLCMLQSLSYASFCALCVSGDEENVFLRHKSCSRPLENFKRFAQ